MSILGGKVGKVGRYRPESGKNGMKNSPKWKIDGAWVRRNLLPNACIAGFVLWTAPDHIWRMTISFVLLAMAIESTYWRLRNQ